jgi:hypothetical protein
VGGSGLIYAAIVVMWAVVLVPMWLRRHDEANESRSVDRFSAAMRILSRRGSTPDKREIVMPARTTYVEVTVPVAGRLAGSPRSRTSVGAALPRQQPGGRPRPDAAAAARARLVARRRRTLFLLSSLTLVLTGVALVGLLPAWLPLAPMLLVVGFVVHLRAEARRMVERERRMLARRRADHTRAARKPSPDRISASPASFSARRTASSTAEPGVAAAPASVDAAPVVAASEADELYDAVAQHVWDPVPVPLPTYVTAPKAPRSVRVIDLTRPGAWTSGHLSESELAELEQAQLEQSQTLTDERVEPQSERRPAPRRAVND